MRRQRAGRRLKGPACTSPAAHCRCAAAAASARSPRQVVERIASCLGVLIVTGVRWLPLGLCCEALLAAFASAGCRRPAACAFSPCRHVSCCSPVLRACTHACAA